MTTVIWMNRTIDHSLWTGPIQNKIFMRISSLWHIWRFWLSCMGTLVLLLPNTFKLFVFPICRFWAYLMKFILETRRASYKCIYIYIYIYRCLYNILYFLWLYNDFLIILYNIFKICWVRLLSNYNIKYICTIYTLLDTCLMSLSRFSLRDKVTLRLLKLYFQYSGCGRVVKGAGHKANR